MLSGAGSNIRASTYRYLSSCTTRTSVLKRVSAPGFGSYSRNLSITWASFQAGSSVLPSSTGGETARVDVATVAEARVADGVVFNSGGRVALLATSVLVCADATAPKRKKERERRMDFCMICPRAVSDIDVICDREQSDGTAESIGRFESHLLHVDISTYGSRAQ